MESIQRVSDYTEYARRVVTWNERAKGVIDFSNEAITNQWRLVEEELEELFEAYDLKRENEFYKELADFFVVLSFYDYLTTRKLHPIRTVDSTDVEVLLASIEDDVADTSYLAMLMNSVKKSPEEYLVPVLDSNDSKFFCIEDADKELALATEKYKNRYKGIAVYDIGDGLAVMRDSNNKIMKPSTYKEWNEFI